MQDAALTFPYPDLPEPGTVRWLRPGLGWVRMPLPFRLDHINLWLLGDPARPTVVDTGLGSAKTRDLWRQALGAAQPQQVIVTHFHPDHSGNSGWFAQDWGLPVWMTETEFLWCHVMRWIDPEVETGNRVAFFRRHGLGEDRIAALIERGHPYPKGAPNLPLSYRRMGEGTRLEIDGAAWQVMIGRGHAPEQAMLFNAADRVLIAADQVLPKITPNIGVWPPEPEADPLSRFLETLDRLAALPDDTLVLPSHGLPFIGLHSRLEALRRHHQDRLDLLRAALAEGPKTATDFAAILFSRAFDSHDLNFAMAEAIAHGNHLVALGAARVDDRDGRLIYCPAG